MLKILPIVLTIITVTAAQAQTQTYYHYECADGASFEAAFYPETKAVFLQIDGKSLQLPKRFSLTSQRVSFALKSGGTATIRRAGGTSQCKAN
jgi:hypothetical protein